MEIHGDVTELHAENERLRVENQRLRDRAEQAEDEAEDQENQITDIREQLDVAEAERDRLRARAERAERALAAWIAVASSERFEDVPADIKRWARSLLPGMEGSRALVRRVIAGLDAVPADPPTEDG